MKAFNSFDSFTPAMKAKLDPTYRRKLQNNEPAGSFNMMHDSARYNRPNLLPFTANNRVNRVTDRLI